MLVVLCDSGPYCEFISLTAMHNPRENPPAREALLLSPSSCTQTLRVMLGQLITAVNNVVIRRRRPAEWGTPSPDSLSCASRAGHKTTTLGHPPSQRPSFFT